jgi:hypothetical protein
MRLPLLVGCAALAVAACSLGPELVPGYGATRAPGTHTGAVTEAQGVRITIDGSAWQSDPADLGESMTPVLVTIENNGTFPLRIGYPDFSLVGATGFHYAALPPFQAQGRLPVSERSAPGSTELSLAAGNPPPVHTLPMGPPPDTQPHAAPPPSDRPAAAEHPVTEAHPKPGAEPIKGPRANEPRFRHKGFYVAPNVEPLYPGIAAWPYFYPWDGTYYDRLYAEWPRTLPTMDMVNEALPAGVLDQGGSISGFLYFQKVVNREPRVEFEMKLVDANGNVPMGEARIPLVVVE